MRSPEMIALLEKDPDVLKQRLPKANKTRSQRAVMKKKLKRGELTASMIVEKSPWWVKTMKVYQLLVHTPYVGVPAADRVIDRLGIADSKTIGKMTERQRQDLLVYLQQLENPAETAAAAHS